MSKHGTYTSETIPSWLNTPPTSHPESPTETKRQHLPFGELSWEDFERLCLRLVRDEATVEHCQLYGVRGQDQQGIDIYARKKLSTKYTVYQSKRVKKYSAADIKDAVELFIDGDWGSADKTDRFVLCTSCPLTSTTVADAVEAQAGRLRALGIEFVIWDAEGLVALLKDKPEIVDDFFGRAWLRSFCGEERAQRLGKRLDAHQVGQYRQRLADFYSYVFARHDPGWLIPIPNADELLAFTERYVIPDIYDERVSVSSVEKPGEAKRPEVPYPLNMIDESFSIQRRVERVETNSSVTTYKQRQNIEDWLTQHNRTVVLGGPGTGKSTLLRYLVLDLLREEPELDKLSSRWGQFLPVWVPFSLWTRKLSDHPDCSLRDLLEGWFRSWGEERLWPLVEQVLSDERLLLLVDGLDEWASEDAARVALDRLQVFVQQRNLPAVLTCRPRGFERLNFVAADWKLGELSDFTTGQQRELAGIWFRSRFETANTPLSEEDEQRVKLATETFMADLRRSQDLHELAKVPLLLTLLTLLKVTGVSLPVNRFEAFASIINYLIDVHPKRRRQAAADSRSQVLDLDAREMIEVFAFLATYIHRHYPDGVINVAEAQRILTEYFQDEENGFGFLIEKARSYSRALLGVGEQETGILVKRSQDELGFYHRTLQEFLCSLHLSRQPLSEQESLVRQVATEPQWREIVLGLFHLTGRPNDVQRLIKDLETIPVNYVEHNELQVLLTEAAFGNFNCPPKLVRELALRAFHVIETSPWPSLRKRLLGHALDGIRSARLKPLVVERLSKWLPKVNPYWDNVYTAMGTWPISPEVIECLLKALHDEELENQRAAAKSLAKLAHTDAGVGNNLVSLALNFPDATVQAVALEGLVAGWEDHPSLTAILNAYSESHHPVLRLTAIIGKINTQNHSSNDFKELLYLASASGNLHLPLEWKREVAQALIQGWPGNVQIKAAVIEGIQRPRFDPKSLDEEVGWTVLLKGYPQDDAVAELIATRAAAAYGLFHTIGSDIDLYNLLYKNFSEHPTLLEPLDKWIQEEGHSTRVFEVARIALVHKSEAAKTRLLSLLDEWEEYWAAWALLEGWGMDDPEVSEQLTAIAHSTNKSAAHIAPLLPQIIRDRRVCRERLMDLLNAHPSEAGLILEGFARLGEDECDAEVVTIMLEHVLPKHNRDSIWFGSDISRLFHYFSSDERVLQLALKELEELEPSYSPIAWTYGDRQDIRDRILAVANPLPSWLRSQIVEYLDEVVEDDDLVQQLLSQYTRERDVAVKTLASIGIHRHIKNLPEAANSALETLSTELVARGIWNESRKLAAFCGYVSLERLDVFKEVSDAAKNIRLPTDTVLFRNLPFYRLLAARWHDLQNALGADFWRTYFLSINQGHFFDRLAPFAESGSALEKCILESLTVHEMSMFSNLLDFLSRSSPKSEPLLEACLDTLQLSEGEQADIDWAPAKLEPSIKAAEILGEHFSGDQKILDLIIQRSPVERLQEKLILALCEGWPDSEHLDDIFRIARATRREMTYASFFRLISLKSEPEKVFGTLRDNLRDDGERQYPHYTSIARPLLKRLQNDDELYSLLLKELLSGKASPSEQTTYTTLIGLSRGLDPEITQYLHDLIDKQLRGGSPIIYGFDLLSAQFKPVVAVALEFLQPQAVPL